MSWLGEHLTSFSEKIQDITKVVNDNLGGTLTEVSAPSDELRDIIEKCCSQEQRISHLLSEKEELEKNIFILDEQHEEAVNVLLAQKSDLSAENKRLKQQLSENAKHGPSSNSDSDDFSDSSCYKYLKLDDMLSNDMENIHNILEDINMLSVLVPFENCHGDTILNDQISRLENAKRSLEMCSEDIGPNCSDSISKINNYIEYLKFISSHSQELLPFVKETASVIHRLHSDAVKFKKNCSSETREDTRLSHNWGSTVDTSDLSDKINTGHADAACQHFAVGSVDENRDNHTIVDVCPVYCQTDDELVPIACESCEENGRLIRELRLENDVTQKKLLQFLKEENFVLNTVSTDVQTDFFCQCENLKNELQKQSEALDNLIRQMQQTEQDLSLQVKQRTEEAEGLIKVLRDKEAVLIAKEKIIDSQQRDVNSLKCNIDALERKLLSVSHQSNSIDLPMNGLSTKCGESKNNQSPISPTKLQEQLPMSICDNDKLLLQQKLKETELEKSRLLCVLSEKSQECSTLKSEVHKLTNIVASEKQALLKLQRDNQVLKEGQRTSLDPDLTKEALQNLSQLVRNKDLEIEALQQQNSSLSEVIKQTDSGSEHIQAVIEERDSLLKQISNFKADREKIMVSYNNRDQEFRQQLVEIKELKTELEYKAKELDVLQQQHSVLSQQYEEKQKALINLRNEMISLKQHTTDLEGQQINIKEMYGELLNQMNSDSTVTIAREELSNKETEIESLSSSIKSKDQLINEKDSFIHELSQRAKSAKLCADELEKTVSDVKKANDDLTAKLNDSQSLVQKVGDEKDLLNQKLSDKQSELNLLREMNERLSMTVKEKEFYVQSLEDKISSLSHVIRGNISSDSPGSPVDIDQILSDSKEMYTKAQHFHRERDETLLALSQSQQENQLLKNEIQKLKVNEDHLKNELDRLRKHLLEVEEHYTEEALKAEHREKELRNLLAEAEQSAKVSSSAVLDASHQANVQIASLQEQIAIIANQRDGALGQLSELEDKIQQYVASLNNLQLVLEQMQKGHDQKLKEVEKRWKVELSKSNHQCLELEGLLGTKQAQIEESSRALEAATRLSEKLDAKEEIISNLKRQLYEVEKKMSSTAQEIDSIKSYSEGKVDRVVMKSLVLGYFSTPPGQKSEVVRLLARVLDFNQEEMAKAGIVVSRNSGAVESRGFISSFLGRLPLLNAAPVPRPLQYPTHVTQRSDNEQSFATLFVKFLETESQPVVHMPLPAEKMARELTSKAHSSKNIIKTLATKSSTSSPSRSPLLIGIDASFPCFTPLPALENSIPAPAILQHVLD